MQPNHNAHFLVPLVAALALVSGCEQQAPLVYVLEGQQEVTLEPSVSATKVKVGESVVLRVKRHASGTWKQIPRDQLTPGQCWLYTAPPEVEPEVADNVEWQVEPENAVRFNTEFRMDHTRIATMMRRGRITLRPLTSVRCEQDRIVEGPALQIEVE